MADPRPLRPMLDVVLDALTERGSTAWAATDPAEAWEVLQARLPSWPLDYRGRFECEDCGGRGGSCPGCDGAGHRPYPPTVAALASWASLGWAASDDGAVGIYGAEELARRAVDDVRWRVERFPEPEGYESPSGIVIALAGKRVTLYVPPLGG